MTASCTNALCAGAAVAGSLAILAIVLGLTGQGFAAFLCVLSAGAALYGACLVVGWKVAVAIFKGK